MATIAMTTVIKKLFPKPSLSSVCYAMGTTTVMMITAYCSFTIPPAFINRVYGNRLVALNSTRHTSHSIGSDSISFLPTNQSFSLMISVTVLVGWRDSPVTFSTG